MPPTDDNHLAEILDGCKARNIKVVLPTRDGELLFWSRNASAFTQVGIYIIVSACDSIICCVDKLAFANFGKAMGFPFIPTFNSPEDMKCSTFVVKERFGAGARSIGINLKKDAALAHAATLENPIFQPFVEGIEISVDAWIDPASKVKGVVLRKREILMAGESQVTTTFRDDSIEKIMIRVLQALKLSGPVVIQAIITGPSELQIIECNARFGGASTTALKAGLDSLYWSLLVAQGEDASGYAFARILGEIRQVRVPQDLHFNVNDNNF
jgi:carbamoyl-phosphate synthase large subunit